MVNDHICQPYVGYTKVLELIGIPTYYVYGQVLGKMICTIYK